MLCMVNPLIQKHTPSSFIHIDLTNADWARIVEYIRSGWEAKEAVRFSELFQIYA